MKKLIALVAAALVGVVSLTAQDNYKTVKGYVLDTNGNPIAGAEVMPTGGGSSAITDADGSFTMSVHPYLKTLTASYAGMGSKKLKVNYDKDMVFNLKNAWKTRAFVSLIGNVGYNGCMYELYGGGGVMAGALGKWGGYAKFTYTNEKDITATAGLVKGFTQNIYGYLGVGYSSIFDYGDDNYPGLGGDLGVIIKPSKHIAFSVGLSMATYFECTYRAGADIGFTYVF